MDSALTREIAFDQFTVTRDTNGDGLTLEGYAAVFNQPTEIDSWEGNFREQFAPGAFKRTLKNQQPVMQFNHGHDSRIGTTPIGAFEEIREDDHGLYVRARLHDNEQVRPVRDAIASGAISGMSIRMAIKRYDVTEPADGQRLELRTNREVALFEAGPVVFPAYAGTAVGVRSQVLDLAKDPSFRAELLRALSEPADTSPDLVDTSDEDTERNTDEPADTPDLGLAGTSSGDAAQADIIRAVRPERSDEARASDLAWLDDVFAAASSKEEQWSSLTSRR